LFHEHSFFNKFLASKFTICEDQRNEAYAGYYLEEARPINVLLLGMTLTGKTSIVKAFINPKYSKAPTGFSDTRSPTLYPLILYDEATCKLYQLNIIDTPGLCEIRANHDEIRNNHQIFSLIKRFTEQNIGFINCICIVLQAGFILHSNLEAVDECIDFCGIKFSENTMIVMTHADKYNSTKLHEFHDELRKHPKTQKCFNYCKLGIYDTGILDHDELQIIEDEYLRDLVIEKKR